MAVSIQSFGRLAGYKDSKAKSASDIIDLFQTKQVKAGGFLPYGNGRSYGDSCLLKSGIHANTLDLNRVVSLDLEAGALVAEPGLLLGDLIHLLKGTGWFPPVVPGTQFVTLGGALANDIHGKNHHWRGTFGAHIQSFVLLRSNDGFLNCSRTENADLFSATIGGLGLTGIVTEITMQLAKVHAHSVLQRTTPFSSLEGYFDLAENQADNHEYAVAWIDQLATGSRFGRGLMLLGDHSKTEAVARMRPKLNVFMQPPFNVLNNLSLTLFNSGYHWAGSRKNEDQIVGTDPFFFPLDAVKNWNRLYGPKGLFQHQSVISLDAAPTIIPKMLQATHKAGEASFLTVLKKFGAIASPGLLSFPRSGHTLTLDFPNRGARTLALLNQLDDLVLEAGGAVNPYKDARMSASMFKASFTNWQRLETLRDPAIVSDFWTRTALAA